MRIISAILGNPLAGLDVAVKKIAEKAKEEMKNGHSISSGKSA